MLSSEVSEYKIESLISQTLFSKNKPLDVKDMQGNVFTLYMEASPIFDSIFSNNVKHPINLINAPRYSFFSALPTYLEKCKNIKDLGVSDVVEVSPEGIAQVRWKMYDYDRDPYKDPDFRGRLSIFAHVPVEEDEYRITEDGFGVEVDNIFLLGNHIRVNYNSDYYGVVWTQLATAGKVLIVKKDHLKALI